MGEMLSWQIAKLLNKTPVLSMEALTKILSGVKF